MDTSTRDMKVCVPTDELLHQVAKSVALHVPFLSATVSSQCTWRTAIAAAESSFGNSDRAISLHAQPRSVGLRIRTAADFSKLGVPKKASENARRVLRKEAQSWPDSPPPHTLTIRATIAENLLPVVSANVMMYGLDAAADDPHVSLTQAELLWDTGAHSTVVVDELLPEAFKEYLTKPENECYRSADGTRVQLDALVAFSNQVLSISCVCVVVSRSVIPDSRVGILLGQNMGINRLVHKSIPRAILSARGEKVPNTVWGDILIEDYVDLDDVVHKF
ncbi:uracil DNA glycosylase [Peltigera leucophlebia]|nr:uracil DNA glycosylase [Peltigera leucophlebia]